jgi:anti-anti-sigma regulatory factor
MSHESSSLQYFIADKTPILIVTFVGPMEFSAVDTLTKCKAEIAKFQDIKFILLYFRDVETVSGDAVGVFAQMQAEIRGRYCELNICSLRPKIREKLLNMGVIRTGELSNNMREALLAFVPASAGGTNFRGTVVADHLLLDFLLRNPKVR